jgi:EKC/KEOPS complex subunit CGI121/TPRKB
MALLQSFNLEHLPSDYTIHIALFRNLKNAAFLHQQLLAGNTDFEYALIDASIVSSFPHTRFTNFAVILPILPSTPKAPFIHNHVTFMC